MWNIQTSVAGLLALAKYLRMWTVIVSVVSSNADYQFTFRFLRSIGKGVNRVMMIVMYSYRMQY